MPTGVYERTKPTWSKGLTAATNASLALRADKMRGRKQSSATIEKRMSKIRGRKNPKCGRSGEKHWNYGNTGFVPWNKDIKTGPQSPERIAKMSGDNNPNRKRLKEKSPYWIQGVPTYVKTLHARIRYIFGKADHCEIEGCSGKSVTFEWSNKRHDYKSLDREDWQQACRSCHIKYDAKHHDIYASRRNQRRALQ